MPPSTREEFITKAVTKHGSRYDYSLVEYSGDKNKVIIRCKIHGVFSQRPSSHLSGCGCHRCGTAVRKIKLKLSMDAFLTKSLEKHGELYDYSNVVFENNRSTINIYCKKHNITFNQSVATHLIGSTGCVYCSKETSKLKMSASVNHVIQAFISVHGDRYDYSRVVYFTYHIKVVIICKAHGEFLQVPTSHQKGHGCPKCAGLYKPNTEEFKQEAREVHGDKYDYSLVEYQGRHTICIIICKIHGEFIQSPSSHLLGYGCCKCSGKHHPNTAEFIEKAE